MGAFRRDQRDWKQQVRLNLGIKLIFYMWLGIHKYIYLVQFIDMGMVRHTWIFQKSLSVLNLPYAKTELSYYADVFHIAISGSWYRLFHWGLISREEAFSPIAWQISKSLVGKGNESFLPVADFHGHELYVFVKIYITDWKTFKMP